MIGESFWVNLRDLRGESKVNLEGVRMIRLTLFCHCEAHIGTILSQLGIIFIIELTVDIINIAKKPSTLKSTYSMFAK